MKISLLARLALKDLWFDRKVSFFVIASLIAVISPLMLLFSLKYGVVSQLQQRLLNDPSNLEIKILGVAGERPLDSQWFNQVKQQPNAAFVLPLLGKLNMQADLRKSARESSQNVEFLPTEVGDPIMQLDDKILTLSLPNGVILSQKVAEELNASPGDKLTLFTERTLNGVFERMSIPLVVEGILPLTQTRLKAAFTQLDLLIEIDNYKDGYQVERYVDKPITSGEKLTRIRDRFNKARIYATALDEVAPLARWLKSIGIETETRDREISQVKQIDSVLSTIFLIIASTAVIGAMMSLSGSFLANIERKRKELSFLRLLGVSKGSVQLYLVLQALMLSTLAFILAGGFFAIGSSVINISLGNLANNEFVSLLTLEHFVVALTTTLLLSALVAIYGGRRAMQIQPAESLREA